MSENELSWRPHAKSYPPGSVQAQLGSRFPAKYIGTSISLAAVVVRAFATTEQVVS